MSQTETKPTRILAVDPGMRHLGAAVLEGEDILWYGVKSFEGAIAYDRVRSQAKRYVSKLVSDYAPQVLVIEAPFYAQSVLSGNLCRLTKELGEWARWKGLTVKTYLPTAPKAFFCRERKTKDSLAEALVDRYPFLRRYLRHFPSRRRYWLHVFDAIGLALLCSLKLRQDKRS